MYHLCNNIHLQEIGIMAYVVIANMMRKKQGQRSGSNLVLHHMKPLKKLIMDKVLMKDMEKMNKNIYTTYLEVFHELKIWYILNSIFFEQEKIVAGAKRAALDHNTNITREKVKVIDILI